MTTSSYDGFAIDLDGVVWLSHEPIQGSAEAIQRLRGTGHAVVFVSNDPRSTRAELAARLSSIGAPTDPNDVLTSASTAAASLAEAHSGSAVLVVGTESLGEELRERGLLPLFPSQAEGRALNAVVVGGGNFDQDVLRVAAAAVRGGAELWATNKDPTYPTPDGLAPGTGAIVAAIEVASGTAARNVGKPEPALFEAAQARLGADRPLMAGDSLHSDIGGAARVGMSTALILTGRDTRADIAAAERAPDLVFDDLWALAEALI